MRTLNCTTVEREQRQGLKRSHKRWNIWILMGLFCLLYNPPILPFNSMHLVGVLSIFYLLLRLGRAFEMIRSFAVGGVFLALFLWFGFLLLTVVLLHSEPFVLASSPLYFIIDIVPFGMAMRLVFNDNGWNVEDFISMVVIVAIIQAFLAVTAFLSSDVQDFFVSKFLDYGYGDVVVTLSRYRFFGFAGGLTFEMPILQSIVALLVIHPSRKVQLLDYCVALLLFFSGVINARIAIVVVAIGFFVMFVLDRTPLKKRLKHGMILLLSSVVGIIILLPIISTYAPTTYNFVVGGVEDITAFIFRGDTREEQLGYFSYITDPEKYRLPGRVMEVLVGVGHRTMGMKERYGFSSDIGYINDLWLGGLVYMIPLYLFFALIMIKLWKNRNDRVSYIGILCLIMYPFINIKGIAASANAFSYFLFLLYIVVIDYRCVRSGVEKQKQKTIIEENVS